MKKWSLLLLALGSSLLAGCASLLEAPGQVVATVESVQASAPPGGELSAQIQVSPTNFTGNAILTLTGPAGFALLEPTTPVAVNGPTTVNVRVRVEANTQPGAYTLNFRLQPQGLDPIPLTWNVQVTQTQGGGGGNSQVQPVQVQGPQDEVRLIQGQSASLSLSVFNPNSTGVEVEAYLREATGDLRVTPTVIMDSLTQGQRKDLTFNLTANTPTSGELVFEVHTLSGAYIVGQQTVQVRYRVEASGVNFQARQASGGISEEPSPPPQSTVTYKAQNFRGLLALEALTPGWSVTPNVITVQEGTGQFTLTLVAPQNVTPGIHTVTVRAYRENYETRFEVPVEMRSFALTLDSTDLTASPEATLHGSAVLQGTFNPGSNVAYGLEGQNAALFAVTPTSVPPGPFTLRLIPTRDTAPGTYEVTLRASLEGIVKRARFQVQVQNQSYTAQLLPASLDGYMGQSVQALLRIRTQSGFNGQLTLAVKDALTNNFVPWISTTPATVQVSGDAEIPIAFNIAQGAPAGTYNLKLALFGSQNQEVNFTITVRQPTFHVTLSQTSFSIAAGGSATATLTLTTEGGFSGQVNLSLTGTGADSFTLAPAAIDTSATTWGLVLTASSGAASGTYNLVLNAASGSIVRQIPITITVP